MTHQPFTILDWCIYVPVGISGRETFAQLDTGAQKCRVTKTLAQELGVVGEKDAGGVFGKRKVEAVQIRQLNFLDQEFNNLDATVVGREDMFTDLPFHVDVVLGSDVILSEPIVFDFRMLTMNKQSAYGLTKLASQPLEMSAGLPFFSLYDESELNAIFDLGAGSTVIDKQCLESFPAAEKLFDVPVHDTINDYRTLEFFRIGTVKFGDYELRLEAVVVDLESVSSALGKKIDIILGVNSMLQGRWFVNTTEGRIGFTPY